MKIFVLLLIIFVPRGHSFLKPSKFFNQADIAIKISITTVFCTIGHQIDYGASNMKKLCLKLNDLGATLPYTPLKSSKDKELAKYLDYICNRPAKRLEDFSKIFEKFCKGGSQLTPPDLTTLNASIPDLTTLNAAIPDLTTLSDAIAALTTLGNLIPELTTPSTSTLVPTTQSTTTPAPTTQRTSTLAPTTSTPVPTTTQKSETKKMKTKRTKHHKSNTKPLTPTTQSTSTLAPTTQSTSTLAPTTQRTSTPVPTTTQRLTTEAVCSDYLLQKCTDKCKRQSDFQLNLGPMCLPAIPEKRTGSCYCKKLTHCDSYKNDTCGTLCKKYVGYCRIPEAGYPCVCIIYHETSIYYRLPK